ncbi:MAG TPA: bifunctional phosphoribosyl-AMP cyclohydrolase/phosphoribosyl-ATP diphosphatase HisIE [Gemmatimonadaceae bacterium]|jgi:phosphoribosyl-ATP pyrophosphohydrolase/phosphoribosyl-AMP cyclohydrolase|nr:bifunctional phosphoribosyl-AMP cyclohydrolase/phosphoribosyl-ATP diphosphatase HisIE [Gemmatimonadaceae bacterium]
MPDAPRLDLDAVDFTKGGGLVPVIAQDATSGAVLMTAFADREALERTLETGEMHYRSRSRGLWRKGATSGHVQRVVSLEADCDGDAILARVHSAGPACHTGTVSCFATSVGVADALAELDATLAERAGGAGITSAESPTRPSYTRRLLDDRNLRLKKLGEECAEFVTACADGDRARATEEAADLLYHMLVALRAVGGSLDDLRRAIAARRRE